MSTRGKRRPEGLEGGAGGGQKENLGGDAQQVQKEMLGGSPSFVAEAGEPGASFPLQPQKMHFFFNALHLSHVLSGDQHTSLPQA